MRALAKAHLNTEALLSQQEKDQLDKVYKMVHFFEHNSYYHMNLIYSGTAKAHSSEKLQGPLGRNGLPGRNIKEQRRS